MVEFSNKSTNLDESLDSNGQPMLNNYTSLQRHSLQQQIIDLSNKLRQLEIGIMDVKSSSERRTQLLSDEMPSRLQREIRSFEQKEIQLHKEYQVNMSNLLDGFNRLKEQQSALQQQVKDQIQDIHNSAHEVRVRTESLAKQVYSFEQIKFEFMDSLQNSGPKNNNNQLEIQIASLREHHLSDRQKTEIQFDEVNRLYQNLVVQTHSIKADMMTKLKEHRDEYLTVFNQAEEERARSEKIRLDKHEQDNYNFNQMIQAIEKKVENEVINRKRNEDDLKLYLETKF